LESAGRSLREIGGRNGTMSDFEKVIVEPRPSRQLLIGGAILHLSAGVAVVLSSVPTGIKAGFIAALGLSLARLEFRYGMAQSRGFIARIELLDGRWRLETGDGGVQSARLIGGYAHPLLVILNFRLERGSRRSLALLPDSADAQSLRRLRALLRIGPNGGSSGGALG